MRALIPIAILSLLLAACNTSKHTVKKREPFAAKTVTIDGNDADWPSPYPYYDSKAMISYACTNDRDNFYISIKASDARIRAKILRGGMTVSIDTSGGKDQQLFIHAPMPDAILQGGEGARTRRQSIADGAQQDAGPATRKQAMLRAAEYSLNGFGACDGNYTGNDSTKACGIRVKMDINDYNELVWEAAIPFSTWHHRTLVTRDGGKHISICIEVAGVKMAARTTGGQQGGFSRGGGGGGMGGMRGGGMGGGRGGGGRMGGGRGTGGQGGANDDGAAISQLTRTWLVTGLAYQ